MTAAFADIGAQRPIFGAAPRLAPHPLSLMRLRRALRVGAPQTISAKGMLQLLDEEAIVTSPYWDSVHVLTYLAGHTKAAGAPDPADMWGHVADIAEALRVLSRDLLAYERDVRAAFTRPISQAQFDAAVSFHFNTGAIFRADWVRLWNAGRDKSAILAIMSWDRPPAVVGRRKRERALFADGVYSGDGFASVYPADAKGNVLWGKGRRIDVHGRVLDTQFRRSLPARWHP